MIEQQIPTPQGHDIYWEKWIDAYQNDEIENLRESLEGSHSEGSDYPEELQFDDSDIPAFDRPIKTIMTQFGVLPLTEHSLASSHFKFWVGHANFNLLRKYEKVISDVLGVESVDILTPLRFKISIGKLFKDREVMHRVKETLIKVVESNESKE